MLPRHLQHSLLAAQVIGFATLLRSVAYERWITVLGTTLLVAGAAAALRGRTWGLALSLTSAAAFPVAWMIGIAPFWFLGVGFAGALPFVLASDALRRLDRQATMLLAGIAATAGAAIAVTWKLIAWSVFGAFPAVWPSFVPQNGLTVLLLLGLGAGAFALQSRGLRRERLRIGGGERVRVGGVASVPSGASAELEAQADEEARRFASRRS